MEGRTTRSVMLCKGSDELELALVAQAVLLLTVRDCAQYIFLL